MRYSAEDGDPPVVFDLLGPWSARARCRGENTGSFFPDQGQRAARALTLCAECEVLGECRAYALAQPWQLRGIWGGMAEKDRRKLVHARSESGHAAPDFLWTIALVLAILVMLRMLGAI